ACDSASVMLVVKLKRSLDAPEDRPMFVRSGQASSTYLRKLASAFGAGSVATTSNPRARYCVAQLAPMTPVPTIAILLIGLLYDIMMFSFLYLNGRLIDLSVYEVMEFLRKQFP